MAFFRNSPGESNILRRAMSVSANPVNTSRVCGKVCRHDFA